MFREGFYWLVAGWKGGEPSKWLWEGSRGTTVMLTPLTTGRLQPNVSSKHQEPLTHCHITEELNPRFRTFILSYVFIDRHCSTEGYLFVIVTYLAF